MSKRRTKVICTIGPASQSPDVLRRLILGGMDVARMNFSHGSHEEHLAKAVTIKKLREELRVPVALLLDTRGPEIRTRMHQGGPIQLTAGQAFTLTTRAVEGSPEAVSITYANLPANVARGAKILLDDGLIALTVEQVAGEDILCRVVNSGVLGDKKSVNLPGTAIDMPFMDEQDRSDIRFAYEHDFDFIALSFVRSARDIMLVKAFLKELGPARCKLIAKIENPQGVQNIDEIIREADGIMVARGDLGVEVPLEELPHIQKTLIKKCNAAGKTVITATQMLDSMIKNPRPTRAEVTDVANAIYDGTSAIMLSGETANGKYPVECLETMCRIAEKTEETIHYQKRFEAQQAVTHKDISNAISHATCTTAHGLCAAAIIAVTRSGGTARMIARFKPEVRIVAVTPNRKTYLQLALCWGVTPLLKEQEDDDMVRAGITAAEQAGLVKGGDVVVVTGSSSPDANFTNAMQVHQIGTEV